MHLFRPGAWSKTSGSETFQICPVFIPTPSRKATLQNSKEYDNYAFVITSHIIKPITENGREFWSSATNENFLTHPFGHSRPIRSERKNTQCRRQTKTTQKRSPRRSQQGTVLPNKANRPNDPFSGNRPNPGQRQHKERRDRNKIRDRNLQDKPARSKSRKSRIPNKDNNAPRSPPESSQRTKSLCPRNRHRPKRNPRHRK